MSGMVHRFHTAVWGIVPLSSRMRSPDYSGAIDVHVHHILKNLKGDTVPVPRNPHEIFADRVESFGFVPRRTVKVLIRLSSSLDRVYEQDRCS